ncbi:hypothetical protein HMI55_004971, partial [Coelomomyces lativittatus]
DHGPNDFWADRICCRESTGCSLYFLLYGCEAVFSFDISYHTWMSHPCSQYPMSVEQLIEYRLNQIMYCKLEQETLQD